VLALHLDEVGQRRPVAEHRIDALQHHELAPVVGLHARQPLVEVGGVVVAEAHQFGAGQRAAVVDRGVGIRVEEDRVAGPASPEIIARLAW
jgi:RecG-like helicase